MKINNLISIGIVSSVSIFLVAVTSLTSTVYAQENITESVDPKFLVIQHAQSGTLSKINATTYSLELNDVSDKTILFSDRPDRIVTSVSTLDFIGNWSVGEDSFAQDAPNAVLVVDDTEGQDSAIVVLFNPVYDKEKRTLKYEVIPDNATSIEIPNEFGESTLIVDKSNPTTSVIMGQPPIGDAPR